MQTQWKIFLCMKSFLLQIMWFRIERKNRLPFWRGILLIPARSADDETAFLTGTMKESQALAAEQKLGDIKILGKIRLLG